ncbi:GNAT family N-acetyltransferase [Subsaximicrobium wynnwilliamsii]|uniref:GNAT family N-acetyltransferase n=1 Tax=Subsaximicrobium wynnwilliamsii TaxID=291179 RepID=A0A5C6ZD23_9FLAO|nr:GNAT family N-acetyltransferase [Subsaximicrobium wynnwilliamsii]TXD80952.1 GNAT family N-acetyltransferase [Subsaximicrobium wynnwilliamsii]TXD86988.1 GNAT family N-acetyltransferase [Subsaximicrobium wynnwilliamsii]TXE00641.1 GNAT family N-acetyltransferase [Subsaximicrobium wynnwilliamsii]
MIEIKKYTELSEKLRNQLSSYIEDEFGHIPIVKETEWETPNLTIIFYDNEQIVTFYNIVLREISIDNKKIKIAGLNNVMTPKEFRGMGYASIVLREIENLIFTSLSCEMGLLLCADALIPFYEKFNWYKIDCPVYFEQSSGVKLWGASTMLLTRDEKICADKIELNGLPW